ncbi:glycosyl transferase family A [Bifidobacterium animalis subsp. lactis]|uniref:glycosyltransferase family 2 protein n=1 Tax=Bifidobacterium animalis TaxID=28025 RepID=UPI00101EBD8F|nr:glycosyltransferase family 2 protein [Bifidobacterium animalis]RYM91159.1 glycosyl transferase family A [Bifidobacterium animalis subsp. lactis]
MQGIAEEHVSLTIFTPTYKYNRMTLLPRLYESLIAQEHDDFEWLIVDDGSTDDTESLIHSWAQDSPFPIRCVRQTNSGKHVAHNLGAQLAHGRYFMCVDSDDWLEPFAVSEISHDTKCLDGDHGLIYPKLFSGQKKKDLRWFPQDAAMVELADMRMKYGMSIETAIVFNTRVLRRHPFPMIAGEHFLPEGSAYYDFRSPEVFIPRSNCFYRCEYQEEGLTKNVWNHWRCNPRGTKIALGKRYERSLSYSGKNAFKEKISSLAGIESLNMAPREPVFEDIPRFSIWSLIVLPLSAYRKEKRYGV